ncbi:rhodanese-like domain-containing protein [Tundrisphaera lichenicola]|uniref:rhodanese-like domain-containing protein n=1 Tax=Tundrisphaera lichenicola TaxID=2029860 RepID=UPI003EC0DE63
MDESPAIVGELTPTALKDRLDRGEHLAILDVREDHERDYAAIGLPPGAVDLHVPLGDVPSRLPEITSAASGRALVVYCHHGMRSMVAATWLVRRGVSDVHNLEGGIDAWSRRVDSSVARY